jgi:glycosyltransferase involved in cell wall biosynthesis
VKVNWFSPLPPAKTEIAAYTARLLPALARQAEVTLWTDQAQWDRALEQHAPVRPYTPGKVTWPEINRADFGIYHLGNNLQFHGGIWEMAVAHPGLVVLHDLCMHHFFAGLFQRAEDDDADDAAAEDATSAQGATGVTAYFDCMTRYYGEAGRSAADKFWNGLLPIDYMGEKYPLTLFAVEPARGVLVHTHQAFETLRAKDRWPLAYAPLPYAGPPFDWDRLRAARELAAGQPYRLILFGHIWKNRRLEPLLRALAQFSHKDRFHLDVYGELWDRDYVARLVRDLGITRLVALHGFVPEAVLEAALEAAHLAINLRYPTMGEASASQLRIWGHALPSLVTPVGWYAGLPETAVGFVRPEHEKADIQEHLHAFLHSPARYAVMGAEGRRILQENHDPDSYVRTLLDLTANAGRFRTGEVAHYLAGRAGAEMAAWTSALGSEKLYRHVAEGIHHLVFGPKASPSPPVKKSA